MDELSKIRNVKVAPAIGYIPYPSYPDLPPVGVQDGKLATGGGRKGDMTTRDEIEEEQTARRIAAEERFKIYRDLLLNKSDHDVPYYYIFYSLSSIILSVGLTSIITFIPVHNMLATSGNMNGYCWETLLQATFGFIAPCCGYMLLNCSYWTNISFLRTWKNFAWFFGWLTIVTIVLFYGIHLPWMYVLNLRFPAPFMGIILAYMGIYLAFIPLWYTFPKNWRKEKDIWRKFKFYILAISVNLLITMIYTFYTKVFIMAPEQFQWVAAVVLIPIREFNLWLQTKVGYKTAGSSDPAIGLTCGHNINNRHCFFLAVTLGTIATDLTCWVILAIDFSINVYLELKIVYTKYRKGFNDDNMGEMVDLFTELVINQSVELAVPLTYFVCFMIAYYGPNGEMFGSVKSTYWHHVPVSDLYLFCENLGLFLIADIVSLTLAYILFRFVCGINTLRAFANMQKEFWFLMAVNTAYTINMVRYCFQKINFYTRFSPPDTDNIFLF